MNPILLSIRKRGSIVTCDGMTIDAIRSLNRGSLPRNRYFAKAYPAMELTKREIAVTLTARNALLKRYRARFRFVNNLV